MIKLTVVPSAQFDKQLEEGVVKYGSIAINNRIAFTFKQIASEVGNFIANTVSQTDVMKALRGQGGEDLPAHFGLSDGDANGLVEGMLDIIRNSVEVAFNTQNSDGRGTIIIRAVESDFQKFMALPGAQYVSQPSNITIPVMEWMLFDPSIDIGAAAYQIVFQGDKNFHSENSRSGRAIMVSLEKLGGGGGYVLPSIISQTGGANFLEFAIAQKGVAQNVAQIVIDRIK
jgi:hypothetical protein